MDTQSSNNIDDTTTKCHNRFQALVDCFEIRKGGVSPFDADLLDSQYEGASHGEKVSIAFLLNVWNPSHDWLCGKFDAMDALSIWDADKRKAFCDWARDPFWP